MNAKELRSAAERLANRRPEIGDLDSCILHILATVREDDDEPVTQTRIGFEGWKCHYKAWINMDYPSLQITFPNDKAWVGIGNAKLKMGMPLKSMGHLRRLVAALGE